MRIGNRWDVNSSNHEGGTGLDVARWGREDARPLRGSLSRGLRRGRVVTVDVDDRRCEEEGRQRHLGLWGHGHRS
jgi:hypothetical protein